MDRALWLLLRLRLEGALRRVGRNLRSFKGLLLTLVVSLLFLPMVIASLFAPQFQPAEQLQQIRRFGPLGLLVFCLINLLVSSNEKAVYFSPAEVDLLFPGPFRRRDLLFYRMMIGCFSSLLSALLFTFLMKHHSRGALQAFVGLFLMFELLVLTAMAVGLLAGTVGALAFNRRRKIGLIAVVVLFGALLVIAGPQTSGIDGLELLSRVERSSLVRVVTWPFRPPMMAFTAEHLWPDLVIGMLSGLAVLVGLTVAILFLHAEYYEVAAAASARIYARRNASRFGKMISRPIRTRIVWPMLPWWGGIGPNLWRQMTTAARHPDRIGVLVLFFLGPLAPLFLIVDRTHVGQVIDLRFTGVVIALLTLNASMFVGFDFHSDIDRMDLLKSLPIAPMSLVVGELLVTVLLLVFAQSLCLALAALVRGDATSWFETSIFLLPFDALFVEIEAALFLWFPIRIVPGASMDFPVVGRQVLLLCAKLIVTGFAAGVAAGMGALVYYLLFRNWTATLVMAWLTMAGSALALIPLVVMAFNQYDVARDSPP